MKYINVFIYTVIVFSTVISMLITVFVVLKLALKNNERNIDHISKSFREYYNSLISNENYEEAHTAYAILGTLDGEHGSTKILKQHYTIDKKKRIRLKKNGELSIKIKYKFYKL